MMSVGSLARLQRNVTVSVATYAGNGFVEKGEARFVDECNVLVCGAPDDGFVVCLCFASGSPIAFVQTEDLAPLIGEYEWDLV